MTLSNLNSPASRTSLRALARHLGLSTTTVSVVMSNSPAARAISAATRERIIQAAADLNYRPNYHARSLRGSSTRTIGILATESSEGYYTLVMSGIEQALSAANYLFFLVFHYCQPELIGEYSKLLGERSVDGMLLISTQSPQVVDRPIVSISGHTPREGVTIVTLDHRKAAELALGHLWSLGHRKIAFLRGGDLNIDSDDRWRSTEAVAHDLGLKVDPKLCVTLDSHSWSPKIGYDPTRELLQKRRDFTAMLCFNDIAAIGAIRAIHDNGLRVPHDISVVGFDDIIGAEFSIPSLTTIKQPLIEMGDLAARTLIARIEDPDREHPHDILIKPTLITRESTSTRRSRRKPS